MDALNAFLTSGQYHDALAIIKGLRNGLVYGAKIRFPHSLVMTVLFGSGTWSQSAKNIYKATYTHSTNLGKFVFIYKSLMVIQRKIAGKEQSHHAFLAGLVGGYVVFGDGDNNVNYQIVLYLFSRIMIGLAKLYWEQKTEKAPAPAATYPIFAAVVWGIVMWLFRHERSTLQPSLQASMQYLYNDSENWTSARNWIWHNK